MSDLKQCPFCAEDIKAAAIKCKHCGEMLGETPAPPTAQPVQSTTPKAPVDSLEDVEPLPAPTAAPSTQKEVLYAKHGLEVTPRLIKAPNMSFQMANLNSVRKQKVAGGGEKLVTQGCGGCFGFTGFCLFLGGVASLGESSGALWALGGFLVFGVGIYAMVNPGKASPDTWTVQVLVDDNWVNLCVQMDEADAKRLEDAVNDGFSKLRSSL